eukprot:4870598-Pyramimonas_sp.AAC.1
MCIRDSYKRRTHNKHKLLALRADFWDLRWTALRGTRSAPGAAPEASPGGPQRGSKRSARNDQNVCPPLPFTLELH